MQRHARRFGADYILQKNHVIHLIIRWTASVDRADWSMPAHLFPRRARARL